ncbi:hypothetical protein AB8A05_02770 [Tardiphaga sp. 538_B7_N1_4]|uniref:hypothetical protein n=1 Tax=Tardiphaga sp. 538_B7_N1_4 TaxID=3240778 RepID=UPI001B89EBD6|nr:hypothetical protein [Bradyrhizobium diazoefficiens]MBR0967352.1 hypothetical protein [Bradyrhizobium diazoefficiens]MBR0976673.1 hypothetical protein [Bradyrhizobium diazoefficiens]MBR1005318.1 hypothetical protein [Bradyrhizobium diazoefficiens]MBR1011791.1 hypothetical protein [Bradyrhizobium diazoefficiens]MBR1049132.1 hypothetical protein [Bradyrhizobium diazoefficiens]
MGHEVLTLELRSIRSAKLLQAVVKLQSAHELASVTAELASLFSRTRCRSPSAEPSSPQHPPAVEAVMSRFIEQLY